MTIEDLKNTKIYLKTEDEIKQFQEKVFKLGVEWKDGGSEIDASFHFYYISSNLRLLFSPNNLPEHFLESKRKQIFLEDVLAIEEPIQLTAGMPVLVKDDDGEDWEYDVLGRIRPDKYDCKYKCVGGTFYQCIPYEGNEHLLGTSNPS